MRIINKIKIFSNENKKAKEITNKVIKILNEYNFEITDNNYDLAIAIGGDGSFLRMVKQNNFDSEIYYIGINAGNLGFLQEIKIDRINEFIDKLNENKFKVDCVGIQETKVITENSTSRFYSLNEIVVRDKHLNTTKLTIKIDNEKLESFVGDGILIATSVGSTAYNLSFGGSIVYNNLHTLQITPIAPLNSRSYRSLLNSVIVPENKVITLTPNKEKKNLTIIIDGENNCYENVKMLETVVKDKRIKLLRLDDYDFSNKINEKFLKN